MTVAGPDPAWAEVWSKTLFLEGSRGIGPRARGLGLAAWWIRDDGDLEMTPAARVADRVERRRGLTRATRCGTPRRRR